MHKNIGKKIKKTAVVLEIIGMIGAIIAGIVLMVIDDDYVVYGLLSVFIGPIIIVLNGMLLYGFGELIDQTCDIKKILNGEKLDPKWVKDSSEKRKNR